MTEIAEWRAKLRDLELGAWPYTFSGPISGLGFVVRNEDFEVDGVDGVFAQGDTYAEKVLGIPLTVHGHGAAEVMTNLRALTAAWRPVRGIVDEPLELHLPDQELGSTLYFGRPRTIAADLNLLVGGAAQVLAEFVATDPYRYAFDESSVLIPRANRDGGLLVPAEEPFVFGTTGDSGLRTATNQGIYPTWPTLEISGPVTNPIVENVTTGTRLRFVIELEEADTLTVFTAPRRRAVFLNGTADRYSTKTPTSSFFALEPGPNVLRYSASGASPGSTVAVTWRHAY